MRSPNSRAQLIYPDGDMFSQQIDFLMLGEITGQKVKVTPTKFPSALKPWRTTSRL